MTRPRPVPASLLALCFLSSGTAAFSAIPPPESLAPIQHAFSDPASIQHAFEQLGTSTMAFASSTGIDILSAYKAELIANPLQTKMVTGATVALMGDAIAQSRDIDHPYDRRRAVSFMTFDACYRWLQHEVYPALVAHLHGQYIGGVISSIPPLAHAAKVAGEASGTDPTFIYATLEQTLSSQLGIVPFIYYPVFYTITGLLQHLTPSETIERAKETFLPLMKRNLLFWIPVQFIQFGFVEDSLQIPFITACGLIWTVILSVMAGAAQKNDHATQVSRDQAAHYCVTGAEEGCEINPDDLFPHVLEDVIDLDMETRLKLERQMTMEKNVEVMAKDKSFEVDVEVEEEVEELVGV